MCSDNYIFKNNIIVNRKTLIPDVGDELVFCVNEDVALTSYTKFVDNERNPEYEPIEEVLYTDIFKSKDINGATLHGELCHPVYIGNKRFGFFGCRTRVTDKLTDGHFFLYEMD